jgi:phosphatidate cytidylyltransferase
MLKQRVITAVILVAIVLAVIIWLPPVAFELFAWLCILAGAWEWTRLAGGPNVKYRLPYLALCSFAMAALLRLPDTAHDAVLALSAAWWIGALILVRYYPRGAQAWHKPAVLYPVGMLVLLPGFLAMYMLSDTGQRVSLILLLLGLVAAADSGAYFAGRAFGKHKLSPHVSPNKTWEGFVGGQLAACLVLWLVLLTRGVELTLVQGLLATLGVLLLASASVVGDLFESMLKREAGVKDSGTLLPGHGGVLDRIDSLTAALPVYAVLLQLADVL